MADNCKFPAWDVAAENAMCIACERSGDKDLMCSWIKREQPVPGWVSVKTSECRYVPSIKILRCPQFLPSKDDPVLSKEGYRSLCHSLVVNLYSKVCEYKQLLLNRAERINDLEEELKSLRKSGRAEKKGSGA